MADGTGTCPGRVGRCHILLKPRFCGVFFCPAMSTTMKRISFFIIAISVFCSFFQNANHKDTVQLFHLNGSAQGTSYSIKYLHTFKSLDSVELEILFESVDRSLSLYRTDSKIMAFNKSHSGLKIDSNFREVIKLSTYISKESNGAFDITSRSVSQLWGFGSKSKVSRTPSKSEIDNVLKYTGYGLLQLKMDSLLKGHPSVQIDCDGIAQGYTVDLISELLKKKGISDYLIELGGEIRSSGKKTDGSLWQIQLPGAEPRIVSMPSQGLSITTSGSYSKYKKIGDQYFSHIINPITGRPVNNNIISVTVAATNTAMADGFDNAFMVWGVDKTMDYLKSDKMLGVSFLYKRNDGSIADTCNDMFQKLLTKDLQPR